MATWEGLNEYVSEIELTRVVDARVREVVEYYGSILPESIEYVLVSETPSDDGQRIYGSLWVFSERFACEAMQFLSQDEFQIDDVGKRIYFLRIKRQDYRAEAVSSKSRLSVFYSAPGLHGEITASGLNCRYLDDVLQNWFIPRLAVSSNHARLAVLEDD